MCGGGGGPGGGNGGGGDPTGPGGMGVGGATGHGGPGSGTSSGPGAGAGQGAGPGGVGGGDSGGEGGGGLGSVGGVAGATGHGTPGSGTHSGPGGVAEGGSGGGVGGGGSATPDIAASPQSKPGTQPDESLGETVGGALSDIGDTVAGAFGGDTPTAERGVAANVGDVNMSSTGQTAQVAAGPGTASQAMAERAAAEMQTAHPAVSEADENEVQSVASDIQSGLSVSEADTVANVANLGSTPSGLGEGEMGEKGVGGAISDVVSSVVPGLDIETTQNPVSPASVTHATAQPLSALGTATGVPTGVPGYGNLDDALGTNVALGTSVSQTGLSENEASSLGVSRGGSSDPNNPGGPFGGPGGGDGGGEARRSAGVGGTSAPQRQSQGQSSPAPETSGAFSTQGYDPYGGDVSTYGQPGGTTSHTWFPDITAGVRNAWDSAMKGQA